MTSLYRPVIPLLTWLLLVSSGGALLLPARAYGQADSLQSIGRLFTRYASRTPVEKLFLHLDRPGYISGETMWLKLYAVEGTAQLPLTTSTVAYVEVLNQAHEPVVQAKIALRHATGQGSLVLPAELASGRYTVRAYTSWMRNFGPDYYFHTTIVIVNTRQPLDTPARPPTPTYDPQFFPEGGYLVQGLASRVGFKLTDQAGRSVSADITVRDAVGVSVAHFTTLWAGMGSFSFTPTQVGAAYQAVIKLPNQQTVTCALPAVRAQGYVLRLEDAGPTQLRVVVQAKGQLPSAEKLFLLGHARQQIVLVAEATLADGEAIFTMSKTPLAAGVSHFTLFNSQRQPVCERLYFRPAATLALSAQPDKTRYAPRQKVTLRLAAEGKLPANLSVAVYQVDSLSAGGGAEISSSLWLAADLKGSVEHPERYFDVTNPDAAPAADNLMLTQGWSRFRWPELLAARPDSLPHPPELNGPLLRGRVVNRLTGAPTAGIPIYLTSPSRRVQLYNSISHSDGSVQFELPDLYGRRQLIAQPNTQRDSLYRVELFNSFSPQITPASIAPLTLPEHWAASLLRRHVQTEVQAHYFGNQPAHYLAPTLDSTAFYGPPGEHYLLDSYTRFKVMEEVMREYVPGVLVRTGRDGFHFIVPDKLNQVMMPDPLVLLDGVPIFDVNRIMAFDPLKIEKLDVMTSRYFLGSNVLHGIVSYSTYHGDLAGFPLDPHALQQAYDGLQGQREFYAPRYETTASVSNRLPDFRNLLSWTPTVTVRPGTVSEVTFYTSDQVGQYRILVQGLTGAGLTGSTTRTIEVKAPL